MKEKLKLLLTETLKGMGVIGVEPDMEISDKSVYGEYTTNLALRLASSSKFPSERLRVNKVQSLKFRTPMDIGLEVVNQSKVKSAKFKVRAREHITDRSGQTTSDDKTIYN